MLAALLFSSCVAAVGQMNVHADFPGGSAEVIEIDNVQRLVHIRPALQPGQGWPCWWSFRIDGVEPNQELTVQVSAQPGEFRKGNSLAPNWALPTYATYCNEEGVYNQTKAGKIDGRTVTYRIVPAGNQLWVSWGPPFLPAQADGDLLQHLVNLNEGNETFLLARTRNDNAVYGARIGSGKLAVWVQARQHAWEAGSSWVGWGFANWCACSEPAAVELRKRASIYYIPVMDVDNVLTGAGGKEAVPQDHNRDWSDKPHYPEVAAAQKWLKELHAADRLRVFIDLHNPGPSDKQPYFYGPFDLEKQPDDVQKMYHRWLAIAKEEIVEPLTLFKDYRFATYVKTEEERQRMSSGWVRHNTGPHVLAATLETAWNTKESTSQGYEKVGAALGQAVARYVAELER